MEAKSQEPHSGGWDLDTGATIPRLHSSFPMVMGSPSFLPFSVTIYGAAAGPEVSRPPRTDSSGRGAPSWQPLLLRGPLPLAALAFAPRPQFPRHPSWLSCSSAFPGPLPYSALCLPRPSLPSGAWQPLNVPCQAWSSSHSTASGTPGPQVS